MDATLLDQFRTSLKSTLWCWALYWPGGGILLLYGGLDPVSMAVVLGGIGAFLVLLLSGALSTSSSRSMRELFIERPLYLVAVLVLLVALVPLTSIAEDAGLILFSTAYVGALGLTLVRLWRLHGSIGGSPYAARTDQAFIAVALGFALGMLLFLDAWLSLGESKLPMTPQAVAIANWLNLSYPLLVLVGTRGLREPLRSPRRKVRDGAATLAEPVALAPPAAAGRKA